MEIGPQTCRINWIDLYVPLEQERQYFVVLGPRSITVPVREAGGSHVTIAPDQPSITEGESAAFTLTRGGDTSEALAVRVSVEDPGDFMRGNGYWTDPQPPTTVEFDAGSATATLSLPTRDDWRDIPDGDLTVTIEPGDHRDYRPGATSSASVTVLDNDTKPVFQLSVNEETLTEGETVVFTLTRTVDSTHAVEMLLDFVIQGELRRHVVVFPAGHQVRTIEYKTEDDDLDAPDAVYRMTAVEPDNDYMTVAEPHTVAATVVDNDLPRVSVEALAGSYREGERPVFRITREGRTDSALPVKLKITESGQKTVYNPEDQLGSRTPLMRESYATYDLHLFLDEGDGDEDDGAVEVVLLESDDYVIDPEKSSASFTVIDTDPEPVLRVSRANDSHIVSEDAGTVEFAVSHEGPASQKEVTVDYYTLSGTATAGVDYTATSGTLIFADGETGGVISVPVIEDSRPEHDETFFLVLSNPRNAGLEDGEQSVASLVTIEDDAPRVSIDAVADEVTEGEPAVFNLTRTGDLTDELFVSLLVMEERTGSESNPLFPMTATFPAGTSTVQVTHPTVDDDVDAQPFLVIALVRDLAALARTSTYVPLKYVASVTVQDDELPTVTVEAANQTKRFGTATFNLTREGDPSDPLTVSLDITQTGVLDDEEPLPDAASFATGPSTATFEAGSSTTDLRLTTRETFSQGEQSFSMDRGWVHAALADSDDYITGDPASASTLIVEEFADFPNVYIDDADPVVEGEDLVFTLHRTGDAEGSLTARVQMRVRTFNLYKPYSYHEVTFEPGSHTTTFTVTTQDNELNDGNRQYRVNLVLSTSHPDRPDVHSIHWGYKVGGGTYEHGYPPVGEGWVRDDDIPTVWITPETGEHLEDPEGGAPQFTVHRDSYTSTWIYVFTSTRHLNRWPPPIPDSLYTNSGLPKKADHSFTLFPGESSNTQNFSPRFVGPLGGEAAVFLLPNYCGEDVQGDCIRFPPVPHRHAFIGHHPGVQQVRRHHGRAGQGGG